MRSFSYSFMDMVFVSPLLPLVCSLGMKINLNFRLYSEISIYFYLRSLLFLNWIENPYSLCSPYWVFFTEKTKFYFSVWHVCYYYYYYKSHTILYIYITCRVHCYWRSPYKAYGVFLCRLFYNYYYYFHLFSAFLQNRVLFGSRHNLCPEKVKKLFSNSAWQCGICVEQVTCSFSH